MTPAQIAVMNYPDGILVPFDKVPKKVIDEHLVQYSMKELKAGQFIAVIGSEISFEFVMDHGAKAKRDGKKRRSL